MKEFFGNVKQEWNKLTWPTSKEMKLHSKQVFVFMLVLTLFFAGVDGVISFGLAVQTEVVPEIEYEYDDANSDELLDDDEVYDVDGEQG